MQPSPTLGGDRGTKAAEYSVNDVCQGHEALGLCSPGLQSGEGDDVRWMSTLRHVDKHGRGALPCVTKPMFRETK